VTEHPPTSEIPLPITGAIPVIREWEEEKPPAAAPSTWWWVGIVAAASALTVMTFPGQTAALAPFTDPLQETLSIDRTAVSLSYLVATLLGAAAMPFLGRLIDRFGERASVVAIGAIFSMVLLGASFVTELFGLTASYFGMRMVGQGALTLAATTVVARHITNRPGLALSLVGAIGSAGISLTPLGIERLISLTDPATVWRIEALLVLLVVVPIALFLPRKAPTRTDTGTLITRPALPGYRVSEAVRTGSFWVITGAGFIVGMLVTGLAFHLISILAAQGFSSSESAANFIPQAITALVVAIGIGSFVDRFDPRWGITASMLLLSAGLIFLPFATPGVGGVIFGMVIGASMGALRGVDGVAYLRYFGRGHIGAIRGVASAIGLAATALGPVYFAVGLAVTGSYVLPSLVAALIPATLALVSIVVRPPAPRDMVAA